MRNEKDKPIKHLEVKCELNFFLKFVLFSLLNNLINSNDCIISNTTTISSQWLNSIICLGGKNFRYINIANFSNGNLIIEVTANTNSSERIFYGIKRNGEPLFSNEQYFSKIQSNKWRYEAENLIVIINDKEYILSIGSGSDKYAELYDLNNARIISQIPSIELIRTSQILSFRNSATSFVVSGSTYLIFPFVDKSDYFYIKKIMFNSTDMINNIPQQLASYSISSRGRSPSCFITSSNYIICLFLHIIGLYQYYHIGIYNLVLQKQNEIATDYYAIDYDSNKEFDYFMKCIHLEEDIGVFAFYGAYKNIVFSSMETYPTIIFKKFESPKSLSDYLPSITLNEKTFINYCLLNDLIKITNKKLCYVSTSTEKSQLYIVLIGILNDNKISLRYYTLDIYTNYGFKFLLDMRIHLYNNLISFGFSFCLQSACRSNSNTHYAGFMIFNYPNGTNYDLNVTKYILDNNDITNLTIDLKDYVRIDNNIFGFVYSEIIIKGMENCSTMSFQSSVNKNIYISSNSSLIEEEQIKVNFNSLNTAICHLSYIYKVTEPDFEKYNSYAEVFGTYGSDTEDNFKKEKSFYESRVLDYYIIIEQKLVTNCSDINCALCPEKKYDYCLLCKNDYTIDNDGKICLSETESTEEKKGLIDSADTTVKTNTPSEATEIYHSEDTDSTNTHSIIHINETSPIGNQEIDEIDSTAINTSTNKQMTTPIYDEKTSTNEIKENLTKSTTKEVIKNQTCTNDEIINEGCYNGKMSNEQVEEIFNIVKENFLKNDYDVDNKIIETKNVIIQISTLEEQINNNNTNISTIYLGECENILKSQYNISDADSLLIIKTDIKDEELSATYVQYEIYHPITKEKLDLNYCKDINIVIHVSVNLDDNTVALYDSLSESGYNLFDSEDDFYNDICSTYTSQNGTDMTLTDRKIEIYSVIENISICQERCEFESYNKTTKKAKCNCEIQKNDTETDISKINFSSKNFVNSFISTLKNSNFLVMKCYKLAFNFINFMKNKGRIIMTVIYILFLIILLIYIIKDRKLTSIYINMILKNKIIINNNFLNLEKEKLKKNNKEKKIERTDKENNNEINNNKNDVVENENKANELTKKFEIIEKNIIENKYPKKKKRKKYLKTVDILLIIVILFSVVHQSKLTLFQT